MSRPYIRFVVCDCCGEERKHTGLASGWVPMFWTEIYHQVGEYADKTTNYCRQCTDSLMRFLAERKEKIDAEAVAAVTDSQ